jgi:phospholipid N-methyltransferase
MTDLGGGTNTIESRVPSVVPTADLRACMMVDVVAVETRCAVSKLEVAGTAYARAVLRKGIEGIVR